MSFCSGENDEKNLTTGFFLNKQKPFFKSCFQAALLPWQQHTP